MNKVQHFNRVDVLNITLKIKCDKINQYKPTFLHTENTKKALT